jgi:hypothetical protein
MPEHYYRDLDPVEQANADTPQDLIEDALGILEEIIAGRHDPTQTDLQDVANVLKDALSKF